jgi:speckle-type POZ protein
MLRVKASFKFSLLDEMGQPVPSYSQPWGVRQTFKASGSGSSWGYERFIEKKALEESTYLKDDCFTIRCDVIISKEFRAEDTPKFVTVPPSDLHQHLGCLLSSGEEADVKFRVGGETFAAHRLVLAARSPVFTAQLFGPMREKRTRRRRPIQIDDMEPGVFGAMLHYIYTD